MKVKELIEELQSVKNQDARVDIYVPHFLEDDTCHDYQTDDFEVHRANEHDEYIELYCKYDLETFNKKGGNNERL